MAGEQRSLLLTGASRGIGHATVKRFMQDGWHIITTLLTVLAMPLALLVGLVVVAIVLAQVRLVNRPSVDQRSPHPCGEEPPGIPRPPEIAHR